MTKFIKIIHQKKDFLGNPLKIINIKIVLDYFLFPVPPGDQSPVKSRSGKPRGSNPT